MNMQGRGLGGRKRAMEGERESLTSSLNFLFHFILYFKIFIVLMLFILNLILCLYFSFGKNHVVKYNK